MRRVVSLWLPALAVERITRAAPREPKVERYVVTAASVGQRQVIAAACPAAQAMGLNPGMALAQARAMVPELDVHPADPAGDAALIDRIVAHAVRRWTPLAAAERDGLWLDVTGADHLAGGEARLAQVMRQRLARAGLSARIAIADSHGAAHALARHAPGPVTIVPPHGQAQAIAPLPVAALRLEEEALALLGRLGIATIGELLAMPRGPLARRFGLALVARLDQATGRAPEPIAPVTIPEAPAARRRFAEPIASAEAIAAAIAALAGELATTLGERGLGARRVALAIERVDGERPVIAVGLARASRDAAHLRRLLAPRIETIDPGFGIDALALTATACEPLAAAQIAGADAAPDLAPLVDRLAGRFGAGALWRAAPVESDVPERSQRRVGPLADAQGGDPWPAHWPRPVRLLDPPEPVTATMALLPDGAPARFTWRRREHRVACADGPERIHGEWWRRRSEAAAVRDYYRVEDDSGARFWLYRRGDGIDPATGDLAWFVHGIFA